MLVFAVETSCDETSVCIINSKKRIYSHIIYSQNEHKKFGGVVPELASRSHLEILQKISRQAINEACIKIGDIDVFSATCGPGLIGGLLVGSTFTKALSIGNKKPFVPINHLEGHLLSATFNNKIKFPYISFLLTGGHTQIYLVNGINEYKLLGETYDDAIGEAFDKVAKLIGLQYPGGPEIEKLAKLGLPIFDLPNPLHDKKDLNFSFSGIKTAVNLLVKKQKKLNNEFIKNIASSFQTRIIEILKSKLILLMQKINKDDISISQFSIVGGVASNKKIIDEMEKIIKINKKKLIMPPKFMLSDNAAMIGWACIQKSLIKDNSDINFKVDPRLRIDETVL